jgi:hypothetical protein
LSVCLSLSLSLTRERFQLIRADFHNILHKESVRCPYTCSIGFASQHAKLVKL